MSKTKTILFLLVNALTMVISYNDTTKCCSKLPTGCGFSSLKPMYKSNTFIFYQFVCDVNKLSKQENFTKSSEISNCILTRQSRISIFLTSKNNDLTSFDYPSLLPYMSQFRSYLYFYVMYVNALSIYSIDSENTIDGIDEKQQFTNIRKIILSNSKLNFYAKKGKFLTSCRDFSNQNVTSPRTIFQIKNLQYLSISFESCIYATKICPLLFKNAKMFQLTINFMMNYFFKRNIFSFSDDFDEHEDLNSEIFRLILLAPNNIDLDSNILNRHVFAKIGIIEFYGQINSIQTDLLKPFDETLYNIRLDSYIKRIIHKQGIDWISAMNSNVSVNFTNSSQVDTHFLSFKQISLILWETYYDKQAISEAFPDEDFCLYKNFPFNQLVAFIHLKTNEEGTFFDRNFSCTYLWLTKWFKTYFRYQYPFIR